MPLTKSKSKKAFSHNVEAEMRAGKPQKQAVAIAYAVKRKAKKASGGEIDWADIDEDRPKPRRYANPHDYDSDVDFYKAVGDPRGDEDDEGEDTAPRMSEIKKHKSTKLVNKLTANRQMADIAKASGNKAESEKQFGRLERRGESNRLRDFAKSAEKRGDKAKADTHRKEWSEKVGKGKPAPFKGGGKVKNSCW